MSRDRAQGEACQEPAECPEGSQTHRYERGCGECRCQHPARVPPRPAGRPARRRNLIKQFPAAGEKAETLSPAAGFFFARAERAQNAIDHGFNFHSSRRASRLPAYSQGALRRCRAHRAPACCSAVAIILSQQKIPLPSRLPVTAGGFYLLQFRSRTH